MEQTTWKNNLKVLRIQHNLTQQVAELIGHKSNDRISHWEDILCIYKKRL